MVSLFEENQRLFSTVGCKQQKYNDLAASSGCVRAVYQLACPHQQCPLLSFVAPPILQRLNKNVKPFNIEPDRPTNVAAVVLPNAVHS